MHRLIPVQTGLASQICIIILVSSYWPSSRPDYFLKLAEGDLRRKKYMNKLELFLSHWNENTIFLWFYHWGFISRWNFRLKYVCRWMISCSWSIFYLGSQRLITSNRMICISLKRYIWSKYKFNCIWINKITMIFFNDLLEDH